MQPNEIDNEKFSEYNDCTRRLKKIALKRKERKDVEKNYIGRYGYVERGKRHDS
jgi:hypothetical protein